METSTRSSPVRSNSAQSGNRTRAPRATTPNLTTRRTVLSLTDLSRNHNVLEGRRRQLSEQNRLELNRVLGRQAEFTRTLTKGSCVMVQAPCARASMTEMGASSKFALI